ncbi:MAG: DUF4870 family protein [Acidobacteriota bacterium]
MEEILLEPRRSDSLKTLTFVIYGLYAASYVVGITCIIAIIINYVKRSEAQGTLYESHFRWQIRTFWFGILWSLVGLATTFIGVGFIVLVVSGIWVIYRVVKGMLYLNDGRPMY